MCVLLKYFAIDISCIQACPEVKQHCLSDMKKKNSQSNDLNQLSTQACCYVHVAIETLETELSQTLPKQ